MNDEEFNRKIDDRRRIQRQQYHDRSRSPISSRRRESTSPVEFRRKLRMESSSAHGYVRDDDVNTETSNDKVRSRLRGEIPAAEGRSNVPQQEEQHVGTSTHGNMKASVAAEPSAPASVPNFVTMASRKCMGKLEKPHQSEASDSDTEIIQQLIPQALELSEVSVPRVAVRFPAKPLDPTTASAPSDKPEVEPDSSAISESDAESDMENTQKERFHIDNRSFQWDLRKLARVATERPHLKTEKVWQRCCGCRGPTETQAKEFAGQVHVIRTAHRLAVKTVLELGKKAF